MGSSVAESESELRESKVVTGSRNQSRKKDFAGVGNRSQSQKKDFSGVGSRSQSRKIYARLPVLHKNLIKM